MVFIDIQNFILHICDKLWMYPTEMGKFSPYSTSEVAKFQSRLVL